MIGYLSFSLEFIATVKKVNLLQFRSHSRFLLFRHISKRNAIFTQIQTEQLHDSFSSHDITPVMTNHIDYLLSKIL
jgi:hypothetical protein